MERKALTGVRVIDMTQFEAGPVSTLTLAQMGAEVIKIERPKYGEQARMGARSSRGTQGPGADSIHFALLNPNKKSITLNVKTEKGKELLRELIKKGDVIIENFAAGTMERLGFPWEEIHRINPRIIYGTIKGYDDRSPFAKYPCFDGVAQAMGVVCSITGEHDGPPMMTGPNLADNLSGIYMATSVLAALYEREFTGRGQMVRVNMQEVVMQTCRGAFVCQFDDDQENVRWGNIKFPNRAPHNMYACKKRSEDSINDYVMIYVSPVPGSKQWPEFCNLIGKPEGIDDPVMSDPMERAKHREEIDSVITAWTSQRDKEDVMKTMSEAGIPCGMVTSTKDIATEPFYRETKAVVEVEHPVLGKHLTLGSAWHLSDSPCEVLPSPTLGQHTEEVYKELLGIEGEELAALKAEGVI